MLPIGGSFFNAFDIIFYTISDVLGLKMTAVLCVSSQMVMTGYDWLLVVMNIPGFAITVTVTSHKKA